MKFVIKEKNNDRNFSLIYDEEGYSFDIEPFQKNLGFTSLVVGFLQLEIDCDKRVVYVWGYEPLVKYEETSYFPKAYEEKDLIAVLNEDPIPGVSIRLIINSNWPNSPEWPTYINKKMGWVCIGDPTISDRRLIEFAPDCVAALDSNSEMVAIWLHPRKLPSHLFSNK